MLSYETRNRDATLSVSGKLTNVWEVKKSNKFPKCLSKKPTVSQNIYC